MISHYGFSFQKYLKPLTRHGKRTSVSRSNLKFSVRIQIATIAVYWVTTWKWKKTPRWISPIVHRNSEILSEIDANIGLGDGDAISGRIIVRRRIFQISKSSKVTIENNWDWKARDAPSDGRYSILARTGFCRTTFRRLSVRV